MQLAAKAVKLLQEQPLAATVEASGTAGANATGDHQAAPVAKQPAEPSPPNPQQSQPGATAHGQPTTAVTSDIIPPTAVEVENRKPTALKSQDAAATKASSGLRRSASMPNLSDAHTPDQHAGGKLAANPVFSAPEKATGMNKVNAEQPAKAGQLDIGHNPADQRAFTADSPHAVEQHEMYAAGSMPIVVPVTWAASAPAAAATTADSIMSNSPKESTASIALPNPFVVHTSTNHKSGLWAQPAMPSSYLYAGTPIRNSITSSAGNRQLGIASLFAHGEKENSPKPKLSPGATQFSTYDTVGSKPGVVAPSIKQHSGNVFIQRTSGGSSALSGTVSEHALSAKKRNSGSSLMQACNTGRTSLEGVSEASDMIQNADGHQHFAQKRVKLT